MWKRHTLIKVKHKVGAATLLIHMLAKHDTAMKANITVLGLVPARLRTRVIRTRSMFDLLNADEVLTFGGQCELAFEAVRRTSPLGMLRGMVAVSWAAL